MTTSCVLAHVGFLQVSGTDAVKFMQGYSTCNLDNLHTHQVMPGAICDIQGRMLTSFRILKHQNTLILRMHRPLVPKTIAFLNKYIVFSKASVTDISDDLHCYGRMPCEHTAMSGTSLTAMSGSLLTAMSGLPLTAITYQEDDQGMTLNLGDRQELWLRDGLRSGLRDELKSKLPRKPEQASEAATQRQAWALAEIEAGMVWVEEATSGQFIPQMFNYDKLGAIDFDKGCYLGQEVVARLQYRGALKRRLHRLESQVPRRVGTGLSSGTVVASTALKQSRGACHLLAVLRHSNDDQSPGPRVQFDDGEEVMALLV